MSRYIFIASVALFAGLLLVLAFALAQRDARIGHTLQSDSVPAYAEQVVSPISVHKAALEDDTSVAVPRIPSFENEHFDAEVAQTVSYNMPVQNGAPQVQPPPRTLTEPPRFDASRIISRRPQEQNPITNPPLLSPGSKSLDVPSPIVPEPKESVRASLSDQDEPTVPAPFPSAPPVATFGAPRPADSGTPPPASATLPISSTPPSSSELRSSELPSGSGTLGGLAPPIAEPPSMAAPRSMTPEPLGSPSLSAIAAGPSKTSVPSTGKGTWSMSSGSPGSRLFDGSQNPSLEIVKRAPAEVQVGVAATFTAIVRNVGNATAFDVEVYDTVPRGARLVRTVPQAESVAADGLMWKLGELAAGQETTISMELIPETEGELGSVASVKFAAQASVRTMSTLPKLAIKQIAPGEVLGGDTVTVWIEVSNVGTGTAKDVQLEEDVPAALRHASGARSLGLEVGDLVPGESQKFEIELTAIEAAKVTNVVRATALNAATSESAQPIEIRAPKLQLQLVGPRIRYLERPAPFEAIIENVGTAMARDLYIVAYLPRGLHFSSANNEGTYLPDQHAIAWNLAELAAGTRAKTEFVVLPVEEGKSVVRMTSDAEGLGSESIERDVQVEGQSELTFDIDDDHDPIETNGITTYSVQITNIGTRPDQNVALTIELPDGSTVEHVHAPIQYRIQGRTVAFEAIPSLPSKDRVVAKISVRHSREGTQVLRASLQSSLRPVPVIKEESTQTYVDR